MNFIYSRAPATNSLAFFSEIRTRGAVDRRIEPKLDNVRRSVIALVGFHDPRGLKPQKKRHPYYALQDDYSPSRKLLHCISLFFLTDQQHIGVASQSEVSKPALPNCWS